jgi:hypothetical protein
VRALEEDAVYDRENGLLEKLEGGALVGLSEEHWWG